MKKIRMPIDQKSLYFNILNDNLAGHTPTVATPIKQGKSFDKDLAEIFNLTNKEISLELHPQLINELLKNSKSTNTIRKAFVFDKVSINGINVNVKSKFCIFIKEEIDPQKKQFGRIKMHYPMSLSYNSDSLSINNKKVIDAISNAINNYAFIVNAFEYDFETDILNFDVLIVGENNIPYSKVFLNNKGVGSKLTKTFSNVFDNYDFEIIKLRQFYGSEVSPDNFIAYENKSRKIAVDYLKQNFSEKIEMISDDYPYSLYDFRIKENNEYNYGIIKYTVTKNVYFDLTSAQRSFLNLFEDSAKIYIITNVLENPRMTIITAKTIQDLNMEINSIKYKGELLNGESY